MTDCSDLVMQVMTHWTGWKPQWLWHLQNEWTNSEYDLDSGTNTSQHRAAVVYFDDNQAIKESATHSVSAAKWR